MRGGGFLGGCDITAEEYDITRDVAIGIVGDDEGVVDVAIAAGVKGTALCERDNLANDLTIPSETGAAELL